MQKRIFAIISLFGIVGGICYFLHIIFGRLFYESYNPLRQAVSDLTAADSPSKNIASIFTFLYGICTVIFSAGFWLYVKGKLNKIVNLASIFFCVMTIISFLGYTFFPLSEAGFAVTIQDIMHLIVTGFVVLFTIVSIILFSIGFLKTENHKTLGVISICTLVFLIAGAVLINIVPQEYFGIAERINIYSVIIFTAVLSLSMHKNIL